MSDFVDTSALLTENKMNGLGLDIARLSSATMGLRSENKTMTVMIVILVVIISFRPKKRRKINKNDI